MSESSDALPIAVCLNAYLHILQRPMGAVSCSAIPKGHPNYAFEEADDGQIRGWARWRGVPLETKPSGEIHVRRLRQRIRSHRGASAGGTQRRPHNNIGDLWRRFYRGRQAFASVSSPPKEGRHVNSSALSPVPTAEFVAPSPSGWRVRMSELVLTTAAARRYRSVKSSVRALSTEVRAWRSASPTGHSDTGGRRGRGIWRLLGSCQQCAGIAGVVESIIDYLAAISHGGRALR
ncbi:MAG: hypothetical protein GPOALKHO_000648 [Sodalis sp.]|nr:MAG: hypothetical protein GPOALKHO_000648 [Sodalis sp.]